MARREQTLVELSLSQQVRAANRQTLFSWWRESVSPGAIRVVLICAFAAIAGTLIWRLLI